MDCEQYPGQAGILGEEDVTTPGDDLGPDNGEEPVVVVEAEVEKEEQRKPLSDDVDPELGAQTTGGDL